MAFLLIVNFNLIYMKKKDKFEKENFVKSINSQEALSDIFNKENFDGMFDRVLKDNNQCKYYNISKLFFKKQKRPYMW